VARRVFFSFHYQQDIFRINQIRSIPNVTGTAAAGFVDASLWEATKKTSDAAIKRMIDRALENTSVTVVFIGSRTAGRKYINYEIEQSLARGNGLVGIQIHHLQDSVGESDTAGRKPPAIEKAGFKVYQYVDYKKLQNHIEEAAVLAGKPVLQQRALLG